MAFNVRKATAEDVPELLRLRDERNTVYIKDARLNSNLLPQEAWAEAIPHWLSLPEAAVWVAERDGQLIGYMIGWVRDNLPMFAPQRFGLITEMTVDGHCKQGGVGTGLLEALKTWFKAQDLEHIEVRVPALQPIEQAFWRASGARDYYDHLWYRLE